MPLDNVKVTMAPLSRQRRSHRSCWQRKQVWFLAACVLSVTLVALPTWKFGSYLATSPIAARDEGEMAQDATGQGGVVAKVTKKRKKDMSSVIAKLRQRLEEENRRKLEFKGNEKGGEETTVTQQQEEQHQQQLQVQLKQQQEKQEEQQQAHHQQVKELREQERQYQQEQKVLQEQKRTTTTTSAPGYPVAANSVGTTSKKEPLPRLPSPKVDSVDCSLLFSGDEMELKKAATVLGDEAKRKKLYEEDFLADTALIKLASNCSDFLTSRKYIQVPLSEEEEKFPLAYGILVYKDVGQLERLLRAIYQPQNIYCLHVDRKASYDVHNAVDAISLCLPNVFAPSNPALVEWGHFGTVEAELTCMKKALKFGKKWRYYINLTGQEFPLKTNLDLVRILSVYNGKNDVAAVPFSSQSSYITDRLRLKRPPPGDGTPREKWAPKIPFAHNITFYYGPIHVVVSRAFVNFTVHHPVAQALIQWLADTDVPDETVFGTLNHSPELNAPGMYSGQCGLQEQYGWQDSFNRFKMWEGANDERIFQHKCRGGFNGGICIMSVGDLVALRHSTRLFVNKFYPAQDPLAFACLEELHFNRTRDELLEGSSVTPSHLNISAYQNAKFVRECKKD